MVNHKITYRKISYADQEFINCLNYIIVHYPLIWNGFVSQIINNQEIISIEKSILIFCIPLFKKNSYQYYKTVFDHLVKTSCIKKYIINSEFHFYYTEGSLIIELFKDPTLWKKVITTHALRDVASSLAFTSVTLTNAIGNSIIVDSFIEINGCYYLFFIDRDSYFINVLEKFLIYFGQTIKITFIDSVEPLDCYPSINYKLDYYLFRQKIHDILYL